MHELLEEPANANQLAERLGVHYTTVAHHIAILEQNGLLTTAGPDYGKLHVPTAEMEEAAPRFAKLWERLIKKTEGDGEPA